jgi:putative cell wall-binding protein
VRPHPAPADRPDRPAPPALRRPALAAVVAAAVAAAVLVVLPAGRAAAGDPPPAQPPTTVPDTISDTIHIVVEGQDNSPAAVALRLSQATFDDGTVDEVLLATDAAFADALASGTLQGSDTPLLLTAPEDLLADVEAEIDRLGAQAATILGGVDAIDEDVAEELEDTGIDVARLAGPTRIETAIEVASAAPESSTAIVARGFSSQGDDTQAFADALAAGAWAAAEGWPILLTQTDALSPATRDAIEAGGVERVVLLGGEAALSAEIADELEALEVDVDRVSGATRFDTAVAVAAQRGFASAVEAERVILVEGQADDAWAAGFAAAAHGALASAPVVLANGEGLPPATVEFLLQTAAGPPDEADPTYAVDASDVEDPVLVCAAAASACEQARLLLGLPALAVVGLDDAGEPVPSRAPLTGTVDLSGQDAVVTVFGDCVEEGLVVPAEDGAIALDVQAAPGPCELTFEISFPNGSLQVVRRTIEVAPAAPLTGPVVDTETGGDTYTFVPEGADAPVVVAYGADDAFVVDGEPATIGAFEAAITVADVLTLSADTEDGTIHDLTDVDPDGITAGTVGDVDLTTGTFAIVEPVSGVVLRAGLVLSDDVTYAIDTAAATRAEVEADINEGDRIQVGTTTVRLINQTVTGPARDIQVDAISGIARFRIGGLGDDPLNAEDERFRIRRDDPTQTFRVDGSIRDFAAFADALSEGDEITHRRLDGIERFELDNEPLPAVTGRATETADPDGSPVAPEPSDGGSLVLLTAEGRRAITYSADAVFRIDGAIATEAELEAARTPGDLITYQAADSGSEAAEEIALLNRDLAGEVTDITEGANTYDVAVREGVVHDDLDYTAGVFGGTDSYVINGDAVGLSQFENELALIDRGELIGSVVVRRTTSGTEHRLTTDR